MDRDPPVEGTIGSENQTPSLAPAPRRLAALDAFRGLAILMMLLGNNLSLDKATPVQWTHAGWSGEVHLADFVFPWFLFALGVAIPFAVASHRKRGEKWWNYYGKAIRRAASLVLLGILLDSTVNHAWTPGLGVLQVHGLAYLVAAFLSPLPTLWRAGCAAILLVAHSWLLLGWEVPGHGAGHITESGNAVAFLNEIYLQPWGVRGLVSVVPTAAMVLIGTTLSDLYRRSELPVWRRALLCCATGLLLGGAGYGLATLLPMNKPLWTASYILYTAGVGAVLLAVLHRLVDGTKWGAALAVPLLVPGTNGIVAYVMPILFKINVLKEWSVATDAGRTSVEAALQGACYAAAGRINGGWLYTFGYIGFFWLILFYLYRKRYFLRV